MKLKLSLLLCLCPFFWVYAQENTIKYTTALKIGDSVPDVPISPILNYKTRAASLAGFKGKLLILDFWDTWCKTCIEALPRLDSLQQAFGDSICILPVTTQDEKAIRRFLAQNQYLRGLRVTTVTGDTRLGKLFPHTQLPHEAWIDPNGIVCAITDNQYVNSRNIRAILHGDQPQWAVKSDSIGFDRDKALLGPAQGTGCYSALAPYMPGLPPVFGANEDPVHHTIRTYVVNFPILKMYLMAWEKLLYFPPNHIFLEVSDTARFLYNPAAAYREDWNRRNSYVYESVLPAGTPDSARLAIMRQDLDRYLCLHGRLEKRRLDCLVLSLSGTGTGLFRSKGGKPLNTLNAVSGPKQLRNARLSNILWQMNQQRGTLPVVDETHYTGTADLTLPVSSFANIPEVRAALAPYGLQLKKEVRKIDVFVLTQTH